VRRRPSGCLRTRLVYFDVAAGQLFSVESRYRGFGLVVIGHFHERESPRPPSLPVHGYVNARNLAEWSEKIPKVALSGLKTQVANKQILHFFPRDREPFSIPALQTPGNFFCPPMSYRPRNNTHKKVQP
jgi:hypothetical protein